MTLFEWSTERDSREARESLSPPVLREQHRAILSALEGRSLTDEELQKVTGLNPSSERPRRGELVEMGMIGEAGRRKGQSGRWMTLWKRTT